VNWLLDIATKRPPDFVIGDPADPYLRRWWVVPRNPDCNVYLHHIMKSDDDRAFHDHPWDNMTVVLSGLYLEVRPGMETTVRSEGDVVFRRAEDRHRLHMPKTVVGAWTLFITGPKVRDWGFWEGEKFTPWQDFCSPDNPGVRR
jgi:hypothetical protein